MIFLGIGVLTQKFGSSRSSDDWRFRNHSSLAGATGAAQQLFFSARQLPLRALPSFLGAGFFLISSAITQQFKFLGDASFGIGIALHTDRLARALARAGVGLRALTAHRQAAHDDGRRDSI
jgi:hypothetical protein